MGRPQRFHEVNRGQVDQVAMFLQTHQGFWCSQCLTTALELHSRKYTDRMKLKLAAARKYYQHTDRVICSRCGEIRRCIQFVA